MDTAALLKGKLTCHQNEEDYANTPQISLLELNEVFNFDCTFDHFRSHKANFCQAEIRPTEESAIRGLSHVMFDPLVRRKGHKCLLVVIYDIIELYRFNEVGLDLSLFAVVSSLAHVDKSKAA